MTDSDLNMRKAADPVFNEFGATMYICQAFESSLCFMHALLSEQQRSNSFKASWDFHSEKTLGALVWLLTERIEVPPDLEQYLKEGVKLRNLIVHGYLTENVMRLFDPKGRIEMVKDIERMKKEIKRRDIVVNKLIDALLKKYGTSNKELKDNAERYWKAINFENVAGGDGPH